MVRISVLPSPELKIDTPYYIRAYVYGNSRYTYSETFTSTIEITDINEQLKNYVAPEYEDNYASIAICVPTVLNGTSQTCTIQRSACQRRILLYVSNRCLLRQCTYRTWALSHQGNLGPVNWEYLGGTMPKLSRLGDARS